MSSSARSFSLKMQLGAPLAILGRAPWGKDHLYLDATGGRTGRGQSGVEREKEREGARERVREKGDEKDSYCARR